ncbi:MAG: response regulator [Desulfuromonadales bacterium]|nr:MAG: response regulator [Desulfuromonadales bacterium]
MKNDRILIVDDEADIALILKLQLEDAGYRTVRGRDGVEALELLGRERFDLILLDIRMPRMDGIEVLERIRHEWPDLVVVMMTAHGSEDIAVEAMKKGAVDYISKPFSSDDMKKRVERAIQFNRTRLENERLLQEVEEERHKMEAILRAMADILIAVDRQGLVMTLNQTAAALLGVEPHAVHARPVEEILAADIPAGRLPCRVVLETGEPCLDVAYTLRLGGRSVPVLSSATPLRNAAGEMVGSVEIIRDISAIRALEQEREDFVSMLSHDLKTPITSVVGPLDLVREGRLGPVNGEQKAYLESAMESCTEMVEMIDTLLDVHKFEAGRMVTSLREEDLAQLLTRTVARFEPATRNAGIALSVALPPKPVTLSVDRTKFSRIIGNLLSNALKFTPEGGEIQIGGAVVTLPADVTDRIPPAAYPPESIPREGRFLLLTVRDSGIGIPADSLVTIFDRFVQARNRKQGKASGSGLGLAFCRKAMDAHQGFIWAESEPERGSVFQLLFPIAMS